MIELPSVEWTAATLTYEVSLYAHVQTELVLLHCKKFVNKQANEWHSGISAYVPRTRGQRSCQQLRLQWCTFGHLLRVGLRVGRLRAECDASRSRCSSGGACCMGSCCGGFRVHVGKIRFDQL
jgi:hypothetical protein